MRVRPCLTAVLFIAVSPLPAQEPDTPDAGFLEYLGMLEGQDEDWTMFEEEPLPTEPGDETDYRRNDPVPQGEASTERDDEG